MAPVAAAAVQQPTGLPQFAQDYSSEQQEACVAYMATWKLAKLRLHQDLLVQQKGMALDQGKEQVAESLDVQWQLVTAAIDRKVFTHGDMS